MIIRVCYNNNDNNNNNYNNNNNNDNIAIRKSGTDATRKGVRTHTCIIYIYIYILKFTYIDVPVNMLKLNLYALREAGGDGLPSRGN